MRKDPIVQEARKAGEELARQANYNFHVFFQKLRKNEKEGFFAVPKRVVSKKRVKVPQMPDVR
ncbi:hypothetical protein [Candidatus Kuenenia sp.]|uniref:hypothetical protein n=1 Tax=Candidatus Kuenenia sp. TaxID=2499824 RepID=UPI00321FEF4B